MAVNLGHLTLNAVFAAKKFIRGTMKVSVMKLRPPFKMYGGKARLATWIIDNFPANYEDMTYVETHGGAASVLLNKRPSHLDIYNDLDANIANVFYCLKHKSQEFSDVLQPIDYTEKFFKEALKIPNIYGNVESAVAELVRRRMSRSGMKTHFSWSRRLRGGKPGDLNAWETFKNLLPAIINRLNNVEIYNENAIDIITKFENKNTLFYVDPPYIHSTRTSKKVYDHEMTDEDHIKLGKILNKAKGKVILSGYNCDLYKEIYDGWRCMTRNVKNNAGQTKVKSSRTECLWFNY